MGNEFGQWREWTHEEGLEWHLLQYAPHRGLQQWVRDLNRLYRNESSLYALDFQAEGFEWINFGDWEENVISYLRKGHTTEEMMLIVCNFTPVPRFHYRVGVPSPYGIGDLGLRAYRFIDFLSEAKQKFWQFLPLNPTDPYCDNSPYHSVSAFAGIPLLISPNFLVQDGLLKKEELYPLPGPSTGRVHYRRVIPCKKKIYSLAYERFKKSKDKSGYVKFCQENEQRLDDFALFLSMKNRFRGRSWSEWPEEIRERRPHVLKMLKEKNHDDIERIKFLQYLFFQQWFSLRNYGQKKIQFFGDIPIYVVYDSADVWTHPEFFKWDDRRRLYVIAGVPPDYFSATGQLWGHPVYNWEALKEDHYGWWHQRMKHDLKLFDLIKVDHFRGFVAYWEVPASEKVALRGKWVPAPARDFFSKLTERFPGLPIIAEDLGFITPEVIEIMDHFGFPGMKILLFAFREDFPRNPFLPHNLVRNCVLYTGTHDNNTIRGWYENEISEEEKERLFLYLGQKVSRKEIHWVLIKVAMMSVADRVILPMQDILGLGERDRMNRPARRRGNWQWWLRSEQLTSSIKEKLLKMTETYGRD